MVVARLEADKARPASPLDIEESVLLASKAMVNILAESLLREGVQGLTAPQFRTLDMVHNGVDKPADVANMLGISPPALSWILDKLEKGGYLEREMSREDRRRIIIKLTGMGKDVVQRVNANRRANIRKILKEMETGDIQQLEGGLGAFNEAYLRLKQRNSGD
jgi:DNA-binding MarR family transcriptional regulator